MKINKRILLVGIFVFFGFWSSLVYGEDLLDDFSESVSSIQEEFNNLPQSELEDAIIIDEAIIEINKAIEFVEQSMNDNDTESAIATLDFLDQSLSDISSLIPQEIYSDMSDVNMESFSPEDLEEIQQITNAMDVKKSETFKEMASEMMALNEKGFNAFTVVNKLNDLGVDVIDINVQMENAETMKTWTKEDWANSWQEEVENELTLQTGVKVELTPEEVEDMKAEMAIASASKLGFTDIAEETLSSMNKVAQKFDASDLSETSAILTGSSIQYLSNGKVWSVPVDEGNRHYQEIMEKVNEGSLDLKVDLNSMSSTIQNSVPKQIQEVVEQAPLVDGARFVSESTIEYIKNGQVWSVPVAEGNRHYQEISELVAKGELNITASTDLFSETKVNEIIDADTLSSISEKTGAELMEAVQEVQKEVQVVAQEAAQAAQEAAAAAAKELSLEERIKDTGGAIQWTTTSGQVWSIPKSEGNTHYDNYVKCGDPGGCD